MGGELISYGDALKAFRRGVYQFPDMWKAAIICGNHQQAVYAMTEAAQIIDASSLMLETVNHAALRVDTERGGGLYFIVAEHNNLQDRLNGRYWPHIIVLDPGLKEHTLEELRLRLRCPDIDAKHHRFDMATL